MCFIVENILTYLNVPSGNVKFISGSTNQRQNLYPAKKPVGHVGLLSINQISKSVSGYLEKMFFCSDYFSTLLISSSGLASFEFCWDESPRAISKNLVSSIFAAAMEKLISNKCPPFETSSEMKCK
jgi:hypothetical protein